MTQKKKEGHEEKARCGGMGLLCAFIRRQRQADL